MKRKRKINFFKMITEQAKLTEKGVEMLVKFCIDKDPKDADLVLEYEEKADEARKKLVTTLHETFVTPFDREDIYRLSSAIDDVIDYAKYSIKELKVFDVQPDEYIHKMSEILFEMAKGLYIAAQNLEKNKEITNAECIKVKKLENKANSLYQEALSKLFEGDDIKKILIYREMYRHLNNASDKGDIAADTFLNIIVKM